MILTTLAGVPLDTYYASQRGQNDGINLVIKAKKFGISPYETGETVYYFCKHLALPGIAGALILLLLIFGIFDNFFIGALSWIIATLATILLLSVLREFIRGMKYKIKKGVIYLPGPYDFKREAEVYSQCLNKITDVKHTIGFVGDIMKMNKFDLKFHPDIKYFFKDTDLIIGNLEGIFINKSCPKLKQAHLGNILPKLESLLSDSNKWLLCLSNNHGEDFCNTLFNQTIQIIQNKPKFDVFGRRDVSTIQNKENDITISCATQWSNQKTWDYTFKYNNPNNNPNSSNYLFNFLDNKNFNILYPHWGYENEKYVRTRFQEDAKSYLTGISPEGTKLQNCIRKRRRGTYFHPDYKWDLIFAHHPHVLQPIVKFTDELKDNKGKKFKINKLAVFSAGNFTSGAYIIRKKKHISGIIMKCEIGPLKGYKSKLAIGKMEWRRTKNFKTRVDGELTKRVCIDNEKYRTYNKPFLVNGLLFLIVFLAVYLYNFYF